MQTKTTKVIQKFLLIFILATIIILNISIPTQASTNLENTEDQYMELKAVSIKEVDGADKQVTLEWWSYNLSFKGLDLRFSYDQTKVEPSNLEDNSYLTLANAESSFEFEGDFGTYMDYFVISASDGEYRCVMDLEKYDETGTYIENDASLGYIVNTNIDGGVLIGRMSFRLLAGASIDENTFALKTGTTSPQTGIKIDQTATTSYQNQSVFRFTMLSDDTTLKIQYDTFNYEEEEGEKILPELIYEELDMDGLDEDSTDDISKYTITILENLDNISLKLEKSNENATVKINGEEIDLSNSQELQLNKLGEEDTIIEIEVTAEDGMTKHTYKLVLHRPYGIIKGQIYTEPTNSTTGIYKADIRIYKTEEVNEITNWEEEDVHDKLLTINSQDDETKDDGTYEIYVTPGEYDILLDKAGYLDHIYTAKRVNEGDIIDLGYRELIPGDINKDGTIQILDLSQLMNVFGINSTNSNYNVKYDFNEDTEVQILDLSYIMANFSEVKIIE